jgi:hypothetical protein
MSASSGLEQGYRRGRQLVNWRYGVVLLVGAAAVQLSAFLYDARSRALFLGGAPPSRPTVWLVSSVVLAAAAVILAVAWKLSRYFLLLLAVMCYPYAMELASPPPRAAAAIFSAAPPPRISPCCSSRQCCSPAERCSRQLLPTGPVSCHPENHVRARVPERGWRAGLLVMPATGQTDGLRRSMRTTSRQRP